MPADKPNAELESLAFEIFKTASANAPANRSGEQLATASYRRAEAFLAVRDKVRSGEVNPAKPVGPQLADCCAPNLPKTHPFNLVSQQMGDLGKVNRIAKVLRENPPSQDRSDEDVAHAINRQFETSWTEYQVRTARTIFPAYATN